LDRDGVVTAARLRETLGVDESVLTGVRALHPLLAPRVPELVESFYAWLPRHPQFDVFFTDASVLRRVKGQQLEYWTTFLAAEVDDDYVENRRVVGRVHARIGLGPLVYLQAMRFVSDWLHDVLSAEGVADRAVALDALRTLLQFDTAIVLEAYVAAMQETSEEAAQVALAVADGDLDISMKVRGERDLLGHSINRMASRLRDHAVESERHLWMARSQAELSRAMTGNPAVEALSNRVVEHLCRLVDAQVGAQYELIDSQLHLRASSASSVGMPRRWALGEGLVGRAAQTRQRILVSDLPTEHLRVHFGFGELAPRHVVELPLVYQEEVYGVLELGSIHPFGDGHLELLDRVAPAIAHAIGAARIRARTAELLSATQAQAEELEAQQEELRQTNEELEEQTLLLEAERETIAARNHEIAQAREALEVRATALAQASKYKSDFLASMSHELRTPLNSVLILAKLLGEDRDGNLTQKQVEYAQTIHGSGAELLSLIDEILDLAKIESGKMSVELADYPLADLERYLERTFGPVAAGRGVAFEVRISRGCPAVLRTDVQRVQQVLKNLLSNAFKFTEHGVVGVEVGLATTGFGPDHPVLSTAGRVVAFTVRDTGVGIPADKLHLIFEAFQQVDAGAQRRYGGTGLGLSISREIVRLLGGEITVASTTGGGSAFTFFLPAEGEAVVVTPPPVSAPQPAAVPPPLPPQLLPDDRATIVAGDRVLLVIEDDPRFAGVLMDLARARGFKVAVAGDGASGLALAQRFSPDAITLDLRLPDTSGWTVLDRLKHDPATRHIPVHILSIEAQRARGAEQGAIAYLQKPIDPQGLSDALDNIERFGERTVKRLLVVEDDEAQRASITALIGNSDVTTTAVGTGAAALEALEGSEFDCVVLDLGLPDMTGFELIDQMQEIERHRTLPIIVYTGRALTREEQHRLLRTTDAVIVKDARSPERLLAETTLFLHRVETGLPEDKQRMIRQVREHDGVLAGKRVLVVDDDMRNIFALTSILEAYGMDVVFAESGDEALDRVRSSGAELSAVLMDVMMPGMDGYQATRAIRALPGFEETPIIAVTAKAMKGDRARCIEAGASDYIAKPVDTDQLLSLLRVWLYESPRPR